MQVSYIDHKGQTQAVELSEGFLMEAVKTGDPIAHINRKYADADSKYGCAFDQFKLSAGLIRADKPNPMGLRSSTIGAVLSGQSGIQAGNVQQNTTPFGTSSRAFTMVAVIDEVMSEMTKDRQTDTVVFNDMVANTLSLNTEHFEQPVVDMTGPGGPEKAQAARVSQGALPPKILFFKTSDKIRRIGAWTIGMEWTDQALKNTTIDYVARTTGHYLQVEQDERVYRYLSNLFVGDNDFVVGAVTAVASSALDAASTGGVLTHKAYVKFLARNRKYRKITHLVMDIDTYLKFESRTGRPGSNNYDPTLTRIDPQGAMVNNTFGNDVRIFLVDAAADGGPVPANTIWAIDASIAVTKVINTAAAYNATEEYTMKRTQAMRMDWAEEVFRTLGDNELRPFDALTISA
jgi:hypothetical protein